jgi:hypothetical protein
MGVEMFAVLELIDGAAVRACGLAFACDVQVHLGMGVPGFHICQGAGTKNPALGIEIFGEQGD